MAWNIQPSREEIAFLMEAGVIYRDARRFPEAEEVFRGVRALTPRSEVPEVALGTVQFAMGEVQKAIGHYEKALKLNAASAFAHAQLGEALVFRRIALRRRSIWTKRWGWTRAVRLAHRPAHFWNC